VDFAKEIPLIAESNSARVTFSLLNLGSADKA
jgi:hypothetical protein